MVVIVVVVGLVVGDAVALVVVLIVVWGAGSSPALHTLQLTGQRECMVLDLVLHNPAAAHTLQYSLSSRQAPGLLVLRSETGVVVSAVHKPQECLQ